MTAGYNPMTSRKGHLHTPRMASPRPVLHPLPCRQPGTRFHLEPGGELTPFRASDGSPTSGILVQEVAAAAANQPPVPIPGVAGVTASAHSIGKTGEATSSPSNVISVPESLDILSSYPSASLSRPGAGPHIVEGAGPAPRTSSTPIRRMASPLEVEFEGPRISPQERRMAWR